MSRADDSRHMARALRLAERVVGTTAPNPSVGCVLVRGGRIVGEGATCPPGGPHAEIVALAAAGEAARGASAYVSLEPCDHTGRTGPCSAALIEAGVARVVCAVLDPNPVAGAGLDRLRAAGVDVEVGVLESAARAVNRGFFSRITRGRPWVTSKLAASLDARTALADGRSRWITGPDSRRDVHRLRARTGAILTGIGTLLADDPSLTARPDGGAVRRGTADSAGAAGPLRAIVDARLATPTTARTLRLPGDVVLFTTADDAAIGAYRARLPADGESSGPGGASQSDPGGVSPDGPDGAPPDGPGGASPDGPSGRSDAPPDRARGRVASVRIERVSRDASADAPGTAQRCDLVEVLQRLAALDVNDVLVEAGPTLNGALLERGLIDEVVLYLAPHLLGNTARGLFSFGPLASLDERVPLAIRDVRRIGGDLRIILRPEPREPSDAAG